MSPDAVTIHELSSDLNPYVYLYGRPTTTADPDGNEPITIGVVLGAVAVGALIGAGAATVVSIGVQWATTGSFDKIKWGVDGVAGAAIAGGVGGAFGGGIGALGTGFWVGAAPGAAGGATGGRRAPCLRAGVGMMSVGHL